MTIDETQDAIIAEMNRFDDWLDKYEYLVDAGKRHASIDARYKTREYAIGGCQSQVWLYALADGQALHFKADSDALIVRGLLALLLRVLDGRSPRAINEARLYFLDETGLKAHLSPKRAQGVAAIVSTMRSYAAGHTK